MSGPQPRTVRVTTGGRGDGHNSRTSQTPENGGGTRSPPTSWCTSHSPITRSISTGRSLVPRPAQKYVDCTVNGLLSGKHLPFIFICHGRQMFYTKGRAGLRPRDVSKIKGTVKGETTRPLSHSRLRSPLSSSLPVRPANPKCRRRTSARGDPCGVSPCVRRVGLAPSSLLPSTPGGTLHTRRL